MGSRDRPRYRQRSASELTRRRRADHGCTEEEVRRFKGMRDFGFSFASIAELEGKPVEAVKLALASTRSPNPNSGRAVVNTTPGGLARLRAKALPGETAGQAFERVLGEHEHFERLLRR